MIPFASWVLPPTAIAGAVCLDACPNLLPSPRHLPTLWQLATFDSVPAETRRLWPPARVQPGQQAGFRFRTCYHPVIQALARPGCTGQVVRLPVAITLQTAVDLTVGTCLLAAVIGLHLLSFSQEANHLGENRWCIIGAALMVYLIPLYLFFQVRMGQAIGAYLKSMIPV